MSSAVKAGACWILLLFFSVSATGQETVVGMSERIFKLLDEAQTLVDAGSYDEARALIEGTLPRRMSNYERGHLLNTLGFSWYEQGNLEEALRVYEQALALDKLPNSMLVTLRVTLGQVNLIDENYAAAERHLRALTELPNQDSPANAILLAAALFGQERFEEALAPVLSALEQSELEGEPPREAWLSMLASIYYELDDFRAMREVIERLTVSYPREQYLMNLAALHGQLGETSRQLALIESLLDDGRLTGGSNLQTIASLYMSEELPHKAALVLENAIAAGQIEANVRNLELLSQAWYLSAEADKAIEPLERAAASAESGDLYLRLGRLHMDAYRWEAAESAITEAFRKGGLRDPGQAWLLQAMAQVRLEKFTAAKRGLRQAAEFEKTAGYASQWLRFVDAEQTRIAATQP